MLGTHRASAIRDVLRGSDTDLHVPALCDVEVVAGLRRALLRHSVSQRRVSEAVDDYLSLPLTRHGHQSLVPRMLQLRANFSAYDACYVALAEGIGAELLTADERLRRAAREHTSVPVLP